MKMTLNEEIEYLQSGDWYDKARSVLSNDEYWKLGWAIGDILETLELLRSLAPEPETNADRIRCMSDEELAKMLNDGCPPGRSYIRCGRDNCIDCWLGWLRQPAEEDA